MFRYFELMVASGKGGRKHIAHKPKRGPDASTHEADREISKPNIQRTSKGGFKQPSTAGGLTGEKRFLGEKPPSSSCKERFLGEKPSSSAGEKRNLGEEEEEEKDDVPVQRLIVVQMAKSMLTVIDADDKASVRGVGTLDLDGILGNLCEAMLRVQGLGKPLKDKSKESEANLQVKKDLDSARLQVSNLKKEIKSLKTELEPLQDAKDEAERAKKRVGRLVQRLTNQEHQLKTKYESLAEQERSDLVKQMVSDYDSIMRDTWAAVQPGSDYQIWKSKFDEISKAFDDRLLEEMEEATKADAEAEEGSGSDSSGESSFDEEEGQAEEREKNDEEQPKDNRPAANEETLP